MSRNMDPQNLKIAYIGGGSRMWARTLMTDLALEPDLCGRIDLYDIDFPAAKTNETLGNWIGTRPESRSNGVPGLMRGLRSAITFAGFAREIATHCPDALVINYTNPMTICTRTLTKMAPELKVFGCHEVFGTQNILAELAQTYWAWTI